MISMGQRYQFNDKCHPEYIQQITRDAYLSLQSTPSVLTQAFLSAGAFEQALSTTGVNSLQLLASR